MISPDNIVLNTRDFMLSGESFALVREEGIDRLRTHPIPDDLSAYYESEAYISHTDGGKGLMDRIYSLAKKYNLRGKVRGLGKYFPEEGALLDLGAGTGDFILQARQKGWEVYGVEPNDKARARASEKGLSLSKTAKDLSRSEFDCITLWHVLEHVPNLDEQLEWLANHLKDTGVLVLALPNFRSLDARIYKRYWAAYDTPRHIWHFSPEGIKDTLKPYGLECIGTRPLWLDAFYVSWLSEKYKGSWLAPIRGFFIGALSNFSALFTRQPSSATYYFRKTNSK